MFLSTLIFGLMLGGTYALIALGLSLQYGIARIMNLAYGEVLIAAAFIAFVLFSSYGLSPLWSLFVIVPLGYGPVFRHLPGHDAAAGAPFGRLRPSGS